MHYLRNMLFYQREILTGKIAPSLQFYFFSYFHPISNGTGRAATSESILIQLSIHAFSGKVIPWTGIRELMECLMKIDAEGLKVKMVRN